MKNIVLYVVSFLHRFERMLNEMLNHLERQPRNRDRRIAWLKLIEPLFSAVGLVLLAHFRRIFPLFFQWMHTDDDETVLLVRTTDLSRIFFSPCFDGVILKVKLITNLHQIPVSFCQDW